MDFFARQDQARKNTKWLVLYFILSVLFTIALVYAALALVFLHEGLENRGPAALWNFQLFASVTAGTLAVILVGNLYKIAALSKGGAAVARMLGGRPVDPQTVDPDERKLRNVVEEMAIASGTPVPELYLLEDEEGINAFAAGTSAENAAIGVTRGCLRLMSRDELQGVIAHEFSHILNGDMRLNLRLIGIVHGLLCLAIIGRVLLQTGVRTRRRYYTLGARSGGKGGNPLPLIGLVLLVVGGIGVLFGRLIKSAVSRQREYLADAAAVQFTRNPAGLSGALQKIGGLAAGSRVLNPHAEEASHLFFGNGLKPSWLQGFSTHPPLPDRIRAIDPQWDGSFPRVQLPERTERPGPDAEAHRRAGATRRVAGAPQLSQLYGDDPASSSTTAPSSAPAPPPIHAANALAHLGAPTASHLEFAVQWLAALPAPVAEAVRDPAGAVCLVHLLLVSGEPSERSRQLAWLESHLEPAPRGELKRLESEAAKLEPAHRLPLVELALPALRQLSLAQYTRFASGIKALIESDRQIEVFEFAIQKVVLHHLAPHFQPAKRRPVQYYALRPLLDNVAVLLSILAHVGHTDGTAVAGAFRKGAAVLRDDGTALALLPAAQCGLGPLDAALDRLSQAVPQIKKRVLDACVQTIAADGDIQPREAELLRAIADSLGCPIPPFH